MSSILENIQLGCAVCKIGIYSLCRWLCCSTPPRPRPEFPVICLGLDGSGKTTLLTKIAGEKIDDIQPTTGFLIKCCQFKDCILNVKEVGGGEKVRNFWPHYYAGMAAIMFVIDSACEESMLDIVQSSLSGVLENHALVTRPCLVIGNCQDKPGARSKQQLTEALDLECICQGRPWVLLTTSSEDTEKLKADIQEQFIPMILPDTTPSSEPNTEVGATSDKTRI